MKQINTEVLVIGGGATGTGILRDLAMRGFDALLVEARDLTHGTSGRFHGLLHSGGRYAVKDPQAAEECIEENRILRRIMPECIEDTGGFFIITPEDNPDFSLKFVRGCQSAGIPVEEVSINQMLLEEPLLDPNMVQCFRVPDAAVDSFAAAHANVASAKEYRARVLTYHEVTKLLVQGVGVSGAICYDLVNDEEVTIHADLVINAAGAWVGKIGATAGVEIAIRPGKGTMIAVSHRVVNTVINRCKMPSDGDILVPAHTVAVMGTTDEQIPDPDHIAIEPWEVQLMLDEGEKMIPGFKKMRMLRAWAGVRPLYQETKTDASRDITRSFVLLDHEIRDDVPGLITITSGKWTTYRKMAEATVDLVCRKFDTQRECRTHLEEVPGVSGHQQTAARNHHHLGERLSHIESDQAYGQLICECELATREEIEWAIEEEDAKTLDDIRRDVRLGMGPCQGGFCTLRAAGVLHQLAVDSGQWTVKNTNVSLRDYLEERWKGVLPVLWGQQLHQERLNELIYVNVLGINQLPGPDASRLAAQPYEAGSEAAREPGRFGEDKPGKISPSPVRPNTPAPQQAIIIGAGLAGLTAAWWVANKGLPTKVIAKGWGTTHWGAGCIDVLGYSQSDPQTALSNPLDGITQLRVDNPKHPYVMLGIAKLEQAIDGFQQLCQQARYPLRGSLEHNWMLPTALGSVRPTCLAPESMIAGDLNSPGKMLMVGFDGYLDFWPHLAAGNLRAQGVEVDAIIVEIQKLTELRRVDTMTLARLFDKAEFREQVANAIKAQLGNVERIGLPAVLGLENAQEAQQDLEDRLGHPIFEMPGLPPSVPGIRLHNILVSAIRDAGGRVNNGMEVVDFSTDGDKIETVWTEAAARHRPHLACHFILASGGFLGHGFNLDHSGYAQDAIFNLPLHNCPSPEQRFKRKFLDPDGQSIFKAGLEVNDAFHPIDQDGKTIYENLYAIGATLAYADTIRECSLDGVALATGYAVGEGLATS